MYAIAQVPRRTLDDQRVHAGREAIERLRELAEPLRGLRVLNLTVSPFGTAVSELLTAVVPLLRDLGIEAEWQFVAGDAELNQAARKLYDGLSGRRVDWNSKSAWKWLLYNRLNAPGYEGAHDVVVIHEPQPTALLLVLVESGRELGGTRWVWHCHLDLRQAQGDIWAGVQPILRHYDACVFSHPSFVPADLETGRVAVVPPAIDPSNARSLDMPARVTRQLLYDHGIDPDRHLVAQVGPLTPPFRPTQAIDAVRRVRAECPGLQLLLIQPTVESTVEAWSQFEAVARYAAGDPYIRISTVQGESGFRLINAAQRSADVVLQSGVQGGFSLHLWEAMWKSRPVVAGMTGGLPLQVEAGATGLLAHDDDALASAIAAVLEEPASAARLGANARERVRERHLLTVFIEGELRFFRSLLESPRQTPRLLEEATLNV